jgi:hypothetical protein
LSEWRFGVFSGFVLASYEAMQLDAWWLFWQACAQATQQLSA